MGTGQRCQRAEQFFKQRAQQTTLKSQVEKIVVRNSNLGLTIERIPSWKIATRKGAPSICKAQPILRVSPVNRNKTQSILKKSSGNRYQKSILREKSGTTKLRHRKQEDALRRQSAATKALTGLERKRTYSNQDQRSSSGSEVFDITDAEPTEHRG